MCGITGFWTFTSSPDNFVIDHTIQQMADNLISRGPDSGGIWFDRKSNIAFGHRRLAIVDLSETGHQPMISSSQKFVIIYNGEIYNALELRKQLIAKGYVFQGGSDTEVILNACEAYGVEEATKYLNGMFAFALWDLKARKLCLVRDRLGIKPLYWGIQGDTLFFGSQLKSFQPHPLWNPQLDKNALESFLQAGYISGPQSIYKGIQKLVPGSIITVENKNSIKIAPYWSLKNVIQTSRENSPRFSSNEWVEQLNILLNDAVQKCMVSDVPVGAFLSGGIDSSTVVALMQSTTSVQTFSIGFEDKAYNEANHAAIIARHLGTQHHELYLQPKDALDIIPTIADWCDEPFGDSSQIPAFLVSRLARNQVKVCLSGDGGDELFVGYSRYFQANRIWNNLSKFPLPLRKLAAKTLQSLLSYEANLDIPFFGKNHAAGRKLHQLARLLPYSDRHNLYRERLKLWENPLVYGGEEEPYPSTNLSHASFIEEMQYIDTKTYLPDDILSKVDYASMAVGLECRVPLLDHRVVEFAWSIPLELKTRHPQGKWILREVLKKYVPEILFDRPKMGFGVPIDQWLKGPLRPWAEELLSVKCLSVDGLLNPNPIRQRWEEHVKGTRNWHYSLWPVLMFQAWQEKYKFSL